jgi:hypothetical protein
MTKLYKRIGSRKAEIFKSTQKSKVISGAKELIDELKICKCLRQL